MRCVAKVRSVRSSRVGAADRKCELVDQNQTRIHSSMQTVTSELPNVRCACVLTKHRPDGDLLLSASPVVSELALQPVGEVARVVLARQRLQYGVVRMRRVELRRVHE